MSTTNQHALVGTCLLPPLTDAIADSGTTQIFVMEGAPVANRQPTTTPLRVSLTDGWWVISTHMCDIKINSLPITVTGHIIPNLSIASLFGIQVLTNMGCEVTFDKHKWIVQYNGDVVLQCKKTPLPTCGIFPRDCPQHIHDLPRSPNIVLHMPLHTWHPHK